MTTFTPFTPSVRGPFSFQPTLDGTIYNAVVTWNVFGQRWYLNLFGNNNTLIFCQALVGSPDGVTIESITWTEGVVEVVTQVPHGYAVLGTCNLTITGVTPSGYNGLYRCFIDSTTSFNYSLATNPGLASVAGQVQYNINLASGFFDTSTLVFRDSSQQFEVTP